MKPTKRYLLVFLLQISLSAAIGADQNASKFYKEGKNAISEGRYEEAIASLETALRLKPGSKRYEGALDGAKASAASALIREALGRKHLREQIALLERAERYSPEQPEVLSFRRGLEKALETIRTQISEALRQIDLGSRRTADEILGIYQGLDPWLVELAKLKEALSPGFAEEKALNAIREQRFEAARNIVVRYRSLLGPAEFSQVTSSIGNSLDSDLLELDRALKNSAELRLTRSRNLILLALAACEGASCALPRALEAALVDSVLRPIRALLAVPSQEHPVAHLGYCFLAAETERALEGLERPDLRDSQCAGAKPPPLRIALDVRSDVECRRTATTLAAELISRDWSSSLGYPAELVELGEAEVELRIRLKSCETRSIDQIDRRLRTSNYLVGTQQVQNPDYIEALANVQAAQADLAAYPTSCVCIGTCSSFVLRLCLLGKQLAVTTARRSLHGIEPFTERPLIAPYTFEEFTSGIRARTSGSVTLRRPHEAMALSITEVSGEAEDLQSATSGVTPVQDNCP
ncbi:MAG: hypothetical protein KDD47_10350, partial [Acidobacteria bacterium]|nr:hypothetical protein [Acidobacteriota bacterium]